MPVDHSQNIIKLRNVSFSYGTELVLEDINLSIHRGDYLGVIGPNGGGKTTLLKIMLGLLNPTSGSVELNTKRIGYVSQKAINFDSKFPISVREVVAMGRFGNRGLLHFPTNEDNQRVKQALSQVEMSSFEDRLIGDLSGGQQQRVFIARALAGDPEVIFLDEPTAGVDIKTQEQFYLLLEKLNRELDLTLVLVSHDIDVVANEVTEVTCINKTLVYYGNPKEFIKGNYLSKLYGKEVKFILHEN